MFSLSVWAVIGFCLAGFLMWRWWSGPNGARCFPPLSDLSRYFKASLESLHPRVCSFSTRRNNESEGEWISRKTLEHMFERQFFNVRPDFLRNPETGRNLEIDCYCAELKFGVEYNGAYHIVGETKQVVYKQSSRDNKKLDLADAAGVYILTVPHTVRIRDIPLFIYDSLPDSIWPYIVNHPPSSQKHV